MTAEEPQTFPNMIERFISTITQNWSQSSDQAGLFEIRCLGDNRKAVIQRFAPEALHDAVDFAVRMNEVRLNIYMMINPIDMNASIGAGKGASDTNILRTHYSFADADDAAGLVGLAQLCNQVQPDIVVVTGLVPCERRHAYWRLLEPCEDLSAWTDIQKTIANKFKTDKTVSNPSRIMRVPGTISFPPERKQARGYITEIVTLREAW
tara:strand:- start:2690 stop:3313 length:624 start_codon:yes stop_codon:yes gene_type:complete